MKTKHCNWCDSGFESTVSYQIYCSAECRSEATKEKVAIKYAQKRRKNAKNRKCKSCETPLSIYNDDVLCPVCIIIPSEVAKALKDVKGLANGKN
jgi:hypothetical protein